MLGRFEAVGLAGHLAATWFASLLRDGFALKVTGANPAFAQLGEESLHGLLDGLSDDVDAAAAQVMSGFTQLPAHADVVDGIRALQALWLRLGTLSNGSTVVAEGRLERNELRDAFDTPLSVQDAPAWKPAASADQYALDTCRVPPLPRCWSPSTPGHPRGPTERAYTPLGSTESSRYPRTMHVIPSEQMGCRPDTPRSPRSGWSSSPLMAGPGWSSPTSASRRLARRRRLGDGVGQAHRQLSATSSQ